MRREQLLDIVKGMRRRVSALGDATSAFAVDGPRIDADMLATLKRECGRGTALGEQLASLEAMTRQLDTDLELIVSRLHPPALDDLGMVPALTNETT